jgi:hypothetical protein
MGSKHPSVTFPVSWQGASPRVFDVKQPGRDEHEDRQPMEADRSAAPRMTTVTRRNIEEDLVVRLRPPGRVT